MTNLYLIRHGEMQAMKDFVIDDGLSPLGVLQAERLRDRLAATREIQADVLISSTFARAAQTAEIIAPALNLKPIMDDDVQEMRAGEAYGLPLAEFLQNYKEVDYEENPFQTLAPGAENWGQFMLRVGTTLDRITREHQGKTIVIVCHGGVIDGSLLYFFKMSALTVPPVYLSTQNTSITHWQQTRSEQRGVHWQLVKYNDTFHLQDLEVSSRKIPWTEFATRLISGDDEATIPLL